MFFSSFKRQAAIFFLVFSFPLYLLAQAKIEVTPEDLSKEELEELQKEIIKGSLTIGQDLDALLRAKSQNCDPKGENCIVETLPPGIYRAPAEPIPPVPYPETYDDYEYKDEDILEKLE